MTAVDLRGFTAAATDHQAADDGDPNFVTGHLTRFMRDNGDGTHTVVDSVWGARCADWNGGEPIYTCSRAVNITVCTDPSDPGSSERNSDTGYWNGAESSIEYCDSAARATARYEGEHRQLTQVPAHVLSMLY